MDTPTHPFDALISLEKRVLAASHAFPEINTAENYWSGISFSLNQYDFIIKTGEVSEILPTPDITPLPDVQPWVQGIANIRGRLVPIIDLGAFFGRKEANSTINKKVMLINREEIPLGLTVDQVQGMMQFTESHDKNDIPEELALTIRPFITGCFYRDKCYMVFNTEQLMENRRFLKAAKY